MAAIDLKDKFVNEMFSLKALFSATFEMKAVQATKKVGYVLQKQYFL